MEAAEAVRKGCLFCFCAVTARHPLIPTVKARLQMAVLDLMDNAVAGWAQQYGSERMIQRKSAVIIGAMAIGAVGMSGCATKGFVREQTAIVGGRVDTVTTQLNSVDGTARDALARATAAGKLAEGKFLYQEVLSDDSMKFPIDKADLSPEAQVRLDAFVEKLKSENRNVYVEVQGHTDATGPKAHNYHLGEERAEAVRRYLNEKGVALNRMSTISYGPDAPVAPNENRDGRQANRRVVLIVLS
jgi:peptidoglycan-associated lipoprotein